MSNPYGPPLETVEDWNTALGCCSCKMPVPPPPVLECESLTGTKAGECWLPFTSPGVGVGEEIPTVYEHTEYVPADADIGGTHNISVNLTNSENPSTSTAHATLTLTAAGWDGPFGYEEKIDGVVVDSYEGTWQGFGGGFLPLYADNAVVIAEAPATECTATVRKSYSEKNSSAGSYSNTDHGPFVTGTVSESWNWHVFVFGSETRSEPLTKPQMIAAAMADIPTSWPSTPTGAGCVAELAVGTWPEMPASWPACNATPLPSTTVSATAKKVRYRWRVPVTHLGTYFKITWDVLYEPVGWDDTGIPEEDRPLRYSRKNLTVEWEGPGTGAQSDPSWVAGDWQILAVPEEPGIRKIINVRFTQFRDAL